MPRLSIFLRPATCAFALALAFAVLAPTPALAQPSRRDLAAARQLFRHGVAAGESDDWAQALADFEQAHALSQHADVLLNVAAAQEELGRWLDARATYLQFRAEADAEMLEQHGAAVTAALTDLERHLAHARIDVLGMADGDAVTLDGAALGPEELSVDLPVDPGEHVAALARAGAPVDEERFALTEGGRAEVRLTAPALALSAEPTPLLVPVGGSTTPTSATAPGEPYDATGWIVVGVIGGILVAGGGTVLGVYIALN